MLVFHECRTDFRQLEGLTDELTFKMFPEGTALFSQGDSSKFFFFLRRGLAKVTRMSSEGDQLITELLLPGDLCGALCALDRAPYPVGAEAVTQVDVAKVDLETFHRLAEKFPGLHRCSLEGCATKMGQQRSMMTSIAAERIPQRLWKVFLVLAERLAENGREGLRFPFPFTRREVAEMIGATNETVTRAMGDLKKQNAIVEVEGHVTLLGVHSIEEVEALAGD